MRQLPWLWIIAGLIVALVGANWYIGRVNSSHPALWAMTGGDSGRRNYTAQPLPQKPKVLWAYPIAADPPEAGFRTVTSPVVWQDSTIYAGYGSKVHAVSPDGKKKWAWESKTPIISLALGRQGTLYAQAEGMLYALNPDGTMAWQQEIDARLNEAKPLVVGQGGVIFVTGRTYMTAVTSTGERKWRFQGGNITSAPVELPDGKLAVMLGDKLYLLSRDGDTLWSRSASPVISPVGLSAAAERIYVMGRERFAFDTEGRGGAAGEATLPPAEMVALGRDYVQDGITRYDAAWQQRLWQNADLAQGIVSSIVIVDRNGNTAVIAVDTLAARRRGSVVPTSVRLLDKQGVQKWVMTDVMPIGAPAVAGKGRLCVIGFEPGKDGVQLICIGDQS